jgi:prolipoprotein diacylglyceryl transferase
MGGFLMTPEVWFPNLGIKITHISRVAFSLFGFDVYWYGVIIGSAIMLGVLLMINEAKRTGQNPDEYLDFGIYVIILSIIGARLYYVIFLWEDYSDNLIKIFAIREGGLAIYGAVLTGIIFSAIYARKKKKDFWLIADTVLPSVLLGQICGRWGNFFNREAFGGYTDGLFAMRYLKEQVMESNISADIMSHIINVNGAEYIQVHPTFYMKAYGIWFYSLG